MSVFLGLGIEPNSKNDTVKKTKRPILSPFQKKQSYACRTQPDRTSSRCQSGYIPSKRCQVFARPVRSSGPAQGSKTCVPDAEPPTAIAPRPIWGDDNRRETDHGGASRDRTDDLMLAKQPLSQLSYGPNLRSRRSSVIEANPKMVGLGRLERPTSPLSGVRSNHLSYRPRMIR